MHEEYNYTNLLYARKYIMCLCMLIKRINKIVMGWDSWMISRAHSYPRPIICLWWHRFNT